MMFIALLVPFVLLAVLLGMDRLERWTVRDRDDLLTAPDDVARSRPGPTGGGAARR